MRKIHGKRFWSVAIVIAFLLNSVPYPAYGMRMLAGESLFKTEKERKQIIDLAGRVEQNTNSGERFDILQGWINEKLEKLLDEKITVEKLEQLKEHFDGLLPEEKNEFVMSLWEVISSERLTQIEPETEPQKEITDLSLPPVLAVAIPNTLDLTIQFEETDKGLSILSIQQDVGGKSINIAKTLKKIGRQVETIGFIGKGKVGTRFAEILAKENIEEAQFIKTEGDTRVYPTFLAKQGEFEIRFGSPGTRILQDEANRLLEDLDKLLKNAQEGQFLVIGGRVSPGLPDDFYEKIIDKASKKGIKVSFDFSIALTKSQIKNILQSKPYLIKPNLEEFAKIVNMNISELKENTELIVEKAKELNRQGIEIVVISLGEEGAILVTKEVVLQAKGPKIKVERSVGAGDTFIAGLIYKLSAEEKDSRETLDVTDLEKALRFAVAVGTATCLKSGTGVANLDEANNLLDKIEVVNLGVTDSERYAAAAEMQRNIELRVENLLINPEIFKIVSNRKTIRRLVEEIFLVEGLITPEKVEKVLEKKEFKTFNIEQRKKLAALIPPAIMGTVSIEQAKKIAAQAIGRRRPIIGGNWKMAVHSTREAITLLREIAKEIKEARGVDVVVAPPFPSLGYVAEALKELIAKGEVEEGRIKIAAQNMDYVETGARTGQVSAQMLINYEVPYVILGHSEIRRGPRGGRSGETNYDINRKVKLALNPKYALMPIVCVGESLGEREAGRAKQVVEDMVRESLKGLSREDAAKVVIAYEPVWAIGTGKTATPEQAEEMHSFIRGVLDGMFGRDTASQIRIQYGGSVKPDSIAELIAMPDIDGALVGGASLKAASFAEIVMKSTPLARCEPFVTASKQQIDEIISAKQAQTSDIKTEVYVELSAFFEQTKEGTDLALATRLKLEKTDRSLSPNQKGVIVVPEEYMVATKKALGDDFSNIAFLTPFQSMERIAENKRKGNVRMSAVTLEEPLKILTDEGMVPWCNDISKEWITALGEVGENEVNTAHSVMLTHFRCLVSGGPVVQLSPETKNLLMLTYKNNGIAEEEAASRIEAMEGANLADLQGTFPIDHAAKLRREDIREILGQV